MSPAIPTASPSTVDVAADGCGDDRRDCGAMLVLTLLMVVVGSLIVVPLVWYAAVVLRANDVTAQKIANAEVAKAGLRIALADPIELYDTCGDPAVSGPTTPLQLAPPPGVGLTVTNECYYTETAFALGVDEHRYGTTLVESGALLSIATDGSVYAGSGAAQPLLWQLDSTTESLTDRIWLPNLPFHSLTARSATPYALDASFGIDCDIYFPGTYLEPLTLDGPTYLASGIYYFTELVTVGNGAQVVAGAGHDVGCATDEQAVFDVVDGPSTHNVTGKGVTFVFGDRGRLVVDDSTSAEPLSLRLNRRAVEDGDLAGEPSAGVSIMTVNGDPGGPGALDVPGVINVPASLAGPAGAGPVPATSVGYLPSIHSAAPIAPESPEYVTAVARRTGSCPGSSCAEGAATVSWDPADANGSAVTSYSVAAIDASGALVAGATCSPAPALGVGLAVQTSCSVTGLEHGEPVRFVVTATNAAGASEPSSPSSAVTPDAVGGGMSSLLGPPGAPFGVAVGTAYLDGVVVEWSAPTDDGGSPVTGYEVIATPRLLPLVNPTLGCTGAWDAVSCVLPLPVVGEQYDVSVLAVNGFGAGAAASGPVMTFTPGSTPAPLPVPPIVVPPAPDAVIDVDLSGSASAEVVVPGYIAVPQGWVSVAVADPSVGSVSLSGGLLAANLAVPSSGGVEIGLIDVVVQKSFRIRTEAGGVVSDARIQINDNGAYAINAWEVQ